MSSVVQSKIIPAYLYENCALFVWTEFLFANLNWVFVYALLYEAYVKSIKKLSCFS